jgi:DNA-binding GntR family transcriptional regulator
MTQSETTEAQKEPKSQGGIAVLHERLRKLILDGVYPPGTLIPQEELARTLGVSRTPLREVLRMLQKEGLVEAGRYQRNRVAPFEPKMLDTLYAGRIQLETLGIFLTVPHLQQEDLDALTTALEGMRASSGIDDWEEPHRRFHQLLVTQAGDQINSTIANYAIQSQRYRRILGYTDIHAKSISMVEHGLIMEACREGNRKEAALLLGRHLARTALTVLAYLAPEYEPVAVRSTLMLTQIGANFSEEGMRTKKRNGGEKKGELVHLSPEL